MEDYRPPVWQSLRFMGLVLVFIAALAWYTQTDWGLRIGVIGFIVGALMIMVPRGMGFSSILRWDGGLKVSNPQLDLKNLDERIETMEHTIEKMGAELDEAERADEPNS